MGAAVASVVLWRGAGARAATRAAQALPDICSRWPALHAQAPFDEAASRALQEELAAVGAAQLSSDEVRRLVRMLGTVSAACPDPATLHDAAGSLRVLSSRCVDGGWRSRSCADRLGQLMAREPSLRAALAPVLLSHPEAWLTGTFGKDLVAGLTGREPSRVAGLVPGGLDAGSAALEAFLGVARLRAIADAYVARTFDEALEDWGRGGTGAWHEALGAALARYGTAGALLPRVRDPEGNIAGQLVSERFDACAVVDRPGASTARVERRSCRELTLDPPRHLVLPVTEGDPRESLLFDARARRFHAEAQPPRPSSPALFRFTAAGALSPAGSVAADAPSLRAPRARSLPGWRLRSLKNLTESLPLGAGEGTLPTVVTTAEEWSSGWLSHRLSVVWLSPHGLAVAPAGSSEWLVLGGVDYQTRLPEREECQLVAPFERQTVSLHARGVVPGREGYFLLFGTYETRQGDCEAVSEERGYFTVTCDAQRCVREDLPTHRSGS